MAHVWRWFRDLSGTRSVGMVANPISFTEIDAYSRLHGLRMSGFEIRVILALDELWLSKGRTKGKDEPDFEVEATNGAAVIGLLRGAGARKANK